jgi:Fe-S-cluster containining protein
MTPPSDWPYPVTAFKCHQCGNCCRGDGYVEMTDKDITAAADHLGIAKAEFLSTYALRDAATKTWHLRDQGDAEQSCIFLEKEGGCRIHEAKPQQCRDFPTRWRPANIMDFCAGWRAAAGLPPADRKTMTE